LTPPPPPFFATCHPFAGDSNKNKIKNCRRRRRIWRAPCATCATHTPPAGSALQVALETNTRQGSACAAKHDAPPPFMCGGNVQHRHAAQVQARGQWQSKAPSPMNSRRRMDHRHHRRHHHNSASASPLIMRACTRLTLHQVRSCNARQSRLRLQAWARNNHAVQHLCAAAPSHAPV